MGVYHCPVSGDGMNGADEARAALRNALSAAYGPVYACGVTFAKAQKECAVMTDLENLMCSAVGLIVAAEALKSAADNAEKCARAALAATFQETGAPEVVTMHFRAAMAAKSSFASADQPDLTPVEYMTTPQPDRNLIKDTLKKGINVPGWSLRIPNAQTLRITKRK
jgi:hypothetical protein